MAKRLFRVWEQADGGEILTAFGSSHNCACALGMTTRQFHRAVEDQSLLLPGARVEELDRAVFWSWAAEREKKKPPRDNPCSDEAINKAQAELKKRLGCAGCRWWGGEGNGGGSCGYCLQPGHGLRRKDPDGSCGSREERKRGRKEG